jgi:carboxypeptidase family protein
MVRSFRLAVFALITLLALPGMAFAQGAIAGVVKDTSGAVLPGVNVEAASPALIEKTRSMVTDAAGQYKIIDLRPGVYTVTFTLPGFNTAKREGIELAAETTAQVNVELRVGALEETITVTGQTPVVDVQSASASRTVMSREVMDAMPTARNIGAIGILIPGTGLQAGGGGFLAYDVGGTGLLQQSPLSYHGSNDSVMAIDGMRLNNLCGSGQFSAMYWSDAMFSEISYATGADSAEMGQGGLRINMIPKDGGNSLKGTFFGNWANRPMQAGNLDQPLIDRGLRSIGRLDRLWDTTFSIGGPIRRDKVWFFGTAGWKDLSKTVADSFHDANLFDYVFTADLNQPGHDEGYQKTYNTRVTWQASQKDKISASIDVHDKFRGHKGIISTIAPDTAVEYVLPALYSFQSKWTSTLTGRTLLEVGFTKYYEDSDERYKDWVTPATYSITDQGNGMQYGAYPSGSQYQFNELQTYRVAGSYVTGSHAFQTGMTFSRGLRITRLFYAGDFTARFRDDRPLDATLRIPTDQHERIAGDLATWIQDKWTLGRATLNLALRYDWFRGKVDAQDLPAGRWNPAAHFDEVNNVPNWKDLSPRVGVAYDVFGTGKTAVKVNLSRYVAAQTVGFAASVNPMTTIGLSDQRTWTDDGDFILEDNELGPTQNQNFGQNALTTRTDDAVREGWFSRGYSWEFSTAVQHELLPRISANVAYSRRSVRNQLRTDNILVAPSDYDHFSLRVPTDSRLPDGGGYVISGLYDITPTKRSLQDNYRTFAKDNGGAPKDVYDAYDLTLNARLPGTATLQGGVDLARRSTEDCVAVDSPQLLYCKSALPFLTQWKLLGSVQLPVRLRLSGTFQRVPGPVIAASYSFRSNEAIGLGRSFAAGATATRTVQVIEPGLMYEKPFHQLDLRLTRRVQLRRHRFDLMADLYNVFNSNGIIRINTTWGNNWLRPTQILEGRLFKIGAQWEF